MRGGPGDTPARGPSRSDAPGRRLVRLALEEDLAGFGDVTSAWTVDADAQAVAEVMARESLVVSGTELAAAVLEEVDAEARFTVLLQDGARAEAARPVARLEGAARSLLAVERTMLNLLAHLCGVATQAARFREAVAGTGVTVLDTRKTTAGLRYWEKRAVRDGGCGNHRFGLFDMVLIKDNHVAAAGGVGEAVRRARHAAPPGMKVEAEVEDEAGLRAALAEGADLVMFDNRGLDELVSLVRIARSLRPEVLLEASGGVGLAQVRAVAETGVDFVSSSALTAGAPPADLALDFR